MSVTTLCLLVCLCPQEGSKGRLVLPPPPAPPPKAAPAPTQLSEVERFQRDVFPLRRSAQLSRNAEDLILTRLGADFARPQDLALAFARRAADDELHGLIKVLQRYGEPAVVAELLQLLQSRPMGSATRDAVAAVVALSGDGAKAALLTAFASRYAGVRKAATDLLLARVDHGDLPRLLELSRDANRDVQRKALFLLGALPYPPAQERLLEALSDADPTIAAAACQSLIDHGPDVAPLLEPVVSRAAVGRSFGYAAYALAAIEDLSGKELLTAAMLPHLRAELHAPDTFARATAALALVNLAFRGVDQTGAEYADPEIADPEIVDGLLLVVAPRDYVPNLSLLQRAATAKVVQFTGVDLRGRNEAWHGWWEKARAGFVGTRLWIDVAPESGETAVLTWSYGQGVQRFAGERAELPPPAAATPAAVPEDYLLTGAEMAALVERLRAQGFMSPGLLATAAAETLPVARVLDLRVGKARCRVGGPAQPARWLDALAAEVGAVAERERWQLYRDPVAQPDRVAAWRSEREWLAAHAAPGERARRFVVRVLDAYPALDAGGRERAVAHLLTLPLLPESLTAADGERLVDLIEQEAELGEQALRLADVALLAPADAVGQRLLAVVEARYDRGGKEALPRLFARLGPERVRAAVAGGSGVIRVAAIMEVANLKDVAAVPDLLRALDDGDVEVQRSAIYALGVLGAASARERLLVFEAEPGTPPPARRVAWVALGRIGGEAVFPILQSAVAGPTLEDQLAAIQALGELQDPRAAHLLAQILVAHGLNPRGTQAIAALQRQGALHARPALRRHLGVRDAVVRREIVGLLAELQDPLVIPDLLALLENEPDHARTAVLLSGCTGLDLADVNDRAALVREWWRTHKDLPQAAWFMESLQRHAIKTTLTVDQLAPRAGPAAVPELTRIMVETDLPHVRVLAAALLRETTERDFGLISMSTDRNRLQAIADRYRYYAESDARAR